VWKSKEGLLFIKRRSRELQLGMLGEGRG